MNTAHTILEQLGGNKFLAMTGAKSLVGSDDMLQFRIPNGARRINSVRVELRADDTYDVLFYAIRGVNVREVARAEGVYADGLRETFTRETGLYTSL